MVLRESIPRQVDKKSGVSEKEKGVWDSQGENRGLEFSRKRKGQTSFVYIPQSHKTFFSLSPELMITQQTTQFTFCTRDYITTVYPA